MIESQLLKLLASLEVDDVWKERADGKLLLRITSEDGSEEIPVIEYKARHVALIKDLEEKKRDILENKFAPPLVREVAMGDGKTMQMEYLKKDEQLEPDERREKERLLESIEKEAQRQRAIVAAMNSLQVNYREVIPKLHEAQSPQHVFDSSHPGERTIWTKGIKSAAIFCIREMERPEATHRTGLDVCRAFLQRYVIKEEQAYTPEQLFNNVQQIRHLDRLE